MNPLTEYRARHGMSQADLARHLKTTPTTVNLIERGVRKTPARLAILWPQIIREWSIFDLRPDLEISNQESPA